MVISSVPKGLPVPTPRRSWQPADRCAMRLWSALRRPVPLDADVFLPAQHARLKRAEPPRERKAEPADESEGRVHLRSAQHLPVTIDEMAEARLRGDEFDGDERDERQ